jgi:hypothetical protein
MHPLRFVLDENMRGVLLAATHRHNLVRPDVAIDVVQIGDANAPPRGTPDPDVLIWTEEQDRLPVSWDKRTLPGHLRDHLASGRHCPGILIPPPRPPFPLLIESLAVIAHASLADEYRDRLVHIRL